MSNDEQQRRDAGGEIALAQWVQDARRAQEAEQAQARAKWEASPAGELAAVASELRITAAMMSPQQWAEANAGQADVPAQPRVWFDLTLAERNEVAARRMSALLQKRNAQ
jgi:thioesterase domain-containing protein